MTTKKTRVLVLFGGRSPEHDVSIITALQCIKALDTDRYDPIPLYIGLDGTWLTGDALLERDNYIPSKDTMQELTPVTLDVTPRKTPALITTSRSFLQKTKEIEFDVALLSFHGLVGEDGDVQGLLDLANVPYTGMRTLASAVLMDKSATKKILTGTDVPILPCSIIKKPAEGVLLTVDELNTLLPNVTFPCCLKPANLGSSIGVAKVVNMQEVSDVLAASIFKYDDTAMLEPFVENLVEYNVALRRKGGKIYTSAIERPKTHAELLDFKSKYKMGGDSKLGGSKMGNGKKSSAESSQVSEGMLSLTREINPELPPEFEANIRKWATEVYERVDGTGLPRLDFLCNGKTGEAWFNEANPLPGSFGYFLWEAAKETPILFAELLDGLIEEAFWLHNRTQIPADPVPVDARLFPRR